MKKRRILWMTAIILFAILVCCTWHYADRMCKEYMGERLTTDLIEEQLKVMTEGAILPKGEWSYGMDISHHQPFIIWNKLRILLNEDGRTVLNEDEAVRKESIDYVFMKATEGESLKIGASREDGRKQRRPELQEAPITSSDQARTLSIKRRVIYDVLVYLMQMIFRLFWI